MLTFIALVVVLLAGLGAGGYLGNKYGPAAKALLAQVEAKAAVVKGIVSK